MHKTRILVIIPTLNEGKAIGAVIKNIKSEIPNCDVLVLDGYSSDDTVQVSLDNEAKVIQVAKEFGIAAAIETGILYAYRGDYDILVRVDGDGQHPPSEINKILKSILNNEVDFVIGSRFLGLADYKPNLIRSISIGLISFLLRVLHHIKITDCTSGCQIYNRRLISFFAKDWQFEYSEIRAIWMAHKAGFKIKEEFINMSPRFHGESSFSPIVALLYMFKNIVDVILSVQIRVKRKSNL